MVKQYGMSGDIGQVYFSPERDPSFSKQGCRPAAIQRATAEMIDKEIKEIIFGSIQRALDILGEKKGVMDKGAEVLLEKRRSTERN